MSSVDSRLSGQTDSQPLVITLCITRLPTFQNVCKHTHTQINSTVSHMQPSRVINWCFTVKGHIWPADGDRHLSPILCLVMFRPVLSVCVCVCLCCFALLYDLGIFLPNKDRKCFRKCSSSFALSCEEHARVLNAGEKTSQHTHTETETHQRAWGGSGGTQRWCCSGKRLREIEPTGWKMSLPPGLQPPTWERETDRETVKQDLSLCLLSVWMASVCEASKSVSHWQGLAN